MRNRVTNNVTIEEDFSGRVQLGIRPIMGVTSIHTCIVDCLGYCDSAMWFLFYISYGFSLIFLILLIFAFVILLVIFLFFLLFICTQGGHRIRVGYI